MNEKVTLPGPPMNEEQQQKSLQKMGLDFLSSVHWIIIIIVAILFAGLLVLVKRHKDSVKNKEAEENEKIIEDSGRELDNFYFTSDGFIRPDVIPQPQRYLRGKVDDPECKTFAEDEVNQKINQSLNPNILGQLRRFAKSGGLFSFLNSTMNVKETMQQELAKTQPKVVLTEEQKVAMNLRSRYGGDQLRNPFITSQIKNEILHRREENALMEENSNNDKSGSGLSIGNLTEQQMGALEKAFEN